MPLNLYEKEVRRAQIRFNRVFGGQVVNNLQLREAAILSISWLGVLSKRINKEKGTMKEFHKAKDKLNRFFDEMEIRLKERRSLDEPNGYGTRAGKSDYMRGMRQYLSNRVG